MLTLIIDTSTDKSLVIFVHDKQVLLNLFLPAGVHSSRLLMGVIESGFQQLNENAASLKALAVGVGPGSYTGIRVGAAAASGLAFAKGLPIVGFCSLEGFVSQEEGPFASIIDAKIGGSYVLLQERTSAGILLKSKPQFVARENLQDAVSQYPIKAGPHMGYPDACHLAHLVALKLEKGERGNIEFMYLRTPDYSRPLPL